MEASETETMTMTPGKCQATYTNFSPWLARQIKLLEEQMEEIHTDCSFQMLLDRVEGGFLLQLLA